MNTSILKLLRNEKELRQEDVAQKLSIARQTYSSWETGERTPDIENLIKMADFYNVSLDFLVGRTNIRYNYKADENLEKYINHCITGYYRYLYEK
ncbi:helix-turn-helix transcriptional regulator [Clostridium sp. 1001275B_160808_H3]|uniref:helix-turn-helix domain-containing protein n=1 Tax=Clostridium sp. 1001275B_160808_H3 TaxID=2787110 RepID=UPI00189B1703|nr:helix-turn-helix transcriptional regulator [Clostridium sp. 1001275B_160808_H3]